MDTCRPDARGVPTQRFLLPARRFRRDQLLHFVACDVLPHVCTLALPCLFPALLCWQGVAIWCSMWTFVGGFGVSVGLHRHFAHRSFAAGPRTRLLLGIAGSMAAQGPVAYWVALHRCHHSHSDAQGDPHSPHARANGCASAWGAFLRGHMGWVASHDVPMPARYARDLARDPLVCRLGANYWWLVALGIALPALVGALALGTPSGLLVGAFWGGAVRITVGHHIIWAINSVCHSVGRRPHATTDRSTNCWPLSLVSFGESWHNNHHGSPASARFGRGWLQPDIGWGMIALLALLGAANVRREATTEPGGPRGHVARDA